MPLRGMHGRRCRSRDAEPGSRADAGHLTPEPSRWRCREIGHLRQLGPPPVPTTDARTPPAGGCQQRRGAAAEVVQQVTGQDSPLTVLLRAAPEASGEEARRLESIDRRLDPMHSPQEVAEKGRDTLTVRRGDWALVERPASVLRTQYGQRNRGARGNSSPVASSARTGSPCRPSSRMAPVSTAHESPSDSGWYSLTTTGPAIATTCTLEVIASRAGRAMLWRSRTLWTSGRHIGSSKR